MSDMQQAHQEPTDPATADPDDTSGDSSSRGLRDTVWDTVGAAARGARALWRAGTAVGQPGWPPLWLVMIGALAGIALAVLLLVAVLGWLVDAVSWIWEAAVGPASGAQVLAVLTDPVHAWLDAHNSGVPLGPVQIWWAWVAAGALFYVMALARVRGGRVGWLLFGASGVAMTYAGTPGSGAATAAGLVAGTWALVSVPALRRYAPEHYLYEPADSLEAPRDPRKPGAGRGRRAEVAPGSGQRRRAAQDDVAALAADLYEDLLRRWATRERTAATDPPPVWTVTSTTGQGFRAHDQSGREAAGVALSTESVTEVLEGLAPPGRLRPIVNWQGRLPVAPSGTTLRTRECARLTTTMPQFLRETPDQLEQLARYLQAVREDWHLECLGGGLSERLADSPWPFREQDLERLEELEEQIERRADSLNASHPLVVNVQLQPHIQLHSDAVWPGLAYTFDWIDPATVVAGPANAWNDFGDHRPHQVALIISKLLTDPDPAAAAASVFSTGAADIATLARINGPAGPIHEITSNGTHRTHALRILDAPLLAAEIITQALPLTLTSYDVRDLEHPAGTNMTPLWQGLINRGLINGHLTHDDPDSSDDGPRLHLQDAPAPWMLMQPRHAAAVSRAYECVYPGTMPRLGVPDHAIADARSWSTWVTA